MGTVEETVNRTKEEASRAWALLNKKTILQPSPSAIKSRSLTSFHQRKWSELILFLLDKTADSCCAIGVTTNVCVQERIQVFSPVICLFPFGPVSTLGSIT